MQPYSGRPLSHNLNEVSGSGPYTHRPLFGYERVNSGIRFTHTPIPAVAPVIAHMFYLASQGAELDHIIAHLRTLNFIGARGKPIARSSVYWILTNPFYAGMVMFDGKLWRGTHTPIVTEWVFGRVQLRLKRQKVKKALQTNTQISLITKPHLCP